MTMYCSSGGSLLMALGMLLVLMLNLVVTCSCDPLPPHGITTSHAVLAERWTACQSRLPGSYDKTLTFRKGNGGFVIKSTLIRELNGKYTPGKQYSLDLIGLVNPYEGFIIQARDRWNEGLILGSFIPLDTSKAQTILCHGNEHGTVTHKTKDPVSVQSFIWQAPPTLEGSGEVDFVYSVMHSSLEYWVRINASSSPDLTYKGVQAHDVSPMDAPCPSGPSPNAVYRFTATNPPNCVQSTCDYFLGIRTNDNDPTYLDFVLEGSATGWVGVGFAPSPAMPSADVLGCVLQTSEVTIVDAWNVAGDYNNVRDTIQNVCPHSASYSSGRIQCVFSRQIITNDTAQDVPMNGTYYLLYGRGKSPTGPSPPALTPHGTDFIPPISDNMVDPATVAGNSSGSGDPLHSVMVRVHGVVMTVAFSIFGVIGIFFAAWMKPVLIQGWWYKLHRGMMIASLFLGTFGFICIFVANRHEMFNGHYGLVPLESPSGIVHFTFGMVVMVMLVSNPIIAIFRCKPDAPRRWIYNLVHGAMVGLVFEVLVLINSCLGLYLFEGSVGPMVFLYVFFAAFTVLMYTLLLLSTVFVTEYKGGTPAVVRLVLLCLPTIRRRLFANEARSSYYWEESVPLMGEGHRDNGRVLMNAAIRWVALCLYVSVSISLLVIVVTMVALKTVDS